MGSCFDGAIYRGGYVRCVDTVSIQYNEMQCNAIAPGVGGFSLCSSRCLRGRSFAALRSTSRATPSPSDRCPKLKLTLTLTLNQARTTVIAMHSFAFSAQWLRILRRASAASPPGPPDWTDLRSACVISADVALAGCELASFLDDGLSLVIPIEGSHTQ